MNLLARASRVFAHPLPASPDRKDFHSIARTHVGHRRQINEDRILDCPERGLWAVADGMGGHRGGDVAAEIVIAALREVSAMTDKPSHRCIESALRRANQRIRAHALSAGGIIGSTVVVLHMVGDRARLLWVGDSRGYRIRADRFEQLTRDHSLVQELMDAGAISSEMAATHPQANVVTRALGVDAEVEIETRTFQALPSDILLLCSDGLSRSLDADVHASADLPSATLADRLLETALRRDGSDNISFVLVQAKASTN